MTKKRPPKEGQDRRRRALVIEGPCLEQITTAHVAAFITGQVQSRGLAPKTANRAAKKEVAQVRVRVFRFLGQILGQFQSLLAAERSRSDMRPTSLGRPDRVRHDFCIVGPIHGWASDRFIELVLARCCGDVSPSHREYEVYDNS